MRCTFVGHAGWLVEGRRGSVLIDPILVSEFRDGLFEICPARRVALDRLPEIGAVVISHEHRDHFDLATLARLDRAVPIYTPNAGPIRHALRRLGYRNVTFVDGKSNASTGDLDIVFTPWSDDVPEMGVLVSDGSVTFWDHVDTVVPALAIAKVQKVVGRVDLVAHGYQPMMEFDAITPRSVEFPIEAYRQLLYRARLLDARALVPGSNGYRLRGRGEWLNRFKFPVSRERFIADVRCLLPKTRTFIQNPGDVLDVRPRGTTLRRQAARRGFVRTIRDDARERMRFSPVAVRPALEDHNPRGLSKATLRSSTVRFFEERMRSFCTRLARLHPLRRLEAVIEYRVPQPSGRGDVWTVTFGERGAKIAHGPPTTESDLVMEIGASTIHDLVVGRTRADVVVLAGLCRVFDRAYRVTPYGLSSFAEIAPPSVHENAGANAAELFFSALYPTPKAQELVVDAELDYLLDPRGTRERPFWEREVPPLDAADTGRPS